MNNYNIVLSTQMSSLLVPSPKITRSMSFCQFGINFIQSPDPDRSKKERKINPKRMQREIQKLNKNG